MNATGVLGRAVEGYLNERRLLGYQLTGSDLRRFARYADARMHVGPLTAELQLEWARHHVRKTTHGTGSRRLRTLRPFTRYYRQYEPESVIVEPSILGPQSCRPTPHIYTPEEIEELLKSAALLESFDKLRGATLTTLFGLIAATGLRLSEAINLMDADVNLDTQNLTIRMSKFRKSRRLPMHPSTTTALAAYRERRDLCCTRPSFDSPFFVNYEGVALKKRTIHSSFASLRVSLGWIARGTHPAPRIHDLRHTFAVRRVQLWHEQQASIDQAIFWLCTYLGHAKISDTYWYLTGVPELLAIASERFECLGGVPADDS